MTMGNNVAKRDGRLSVLLVFISFFLLFIAGGKYNWFPFIGENSQVSDKQLKVIPAGLIIREEQFSGKDIEESYSVPAEYTPFFFHPIPINVANRELLMTVKGIGAAFAERIVDHRRDIGPFKSIEDLSTLKGIGPMRKEYFNHAFSFSEVQ